MKKRILFILIFLAGFSIVFSDLQYKNVKPTPLCTETYFPTNEWRKETPVNLGLDPIKLESMNQTIIAQDIGIDSIHIIRYGYLGYEISYDYYNYSNIHLMWSTTKSVISILIGIAHAEGFITNLDEPVLDIFSERNFSNVDSRKEALTIRHLLKMQSGLEWNEAEQGHLSGIVDKRDYQLLTNHTDEKWENWPLNPALHCNQMSNSSDWIHYVLDKPMVANPGTEFYYHSGASHLLSGIISKKTGMNSATFAMQYLFGPLGIVDYIWYNDSQGISNGGYGLWLQPFDMTKIGYLYINNGQWNGVQIVPSSWVQESTQDHNLGSGSSYGYQWWVNVEENYYYTIGFAGQYIIVIPDDSMVVAITSSEYPHYGAVFAIFTGFIQKSIIGEGSIPETTSTTSTTITTSPTTTPVPTSIPSTIDELTTTTSVSSSGWPTSLAILGIVLIPVFKLKQKRKKKMNS